MSKLTFALLICIPSAVFALPYNNTIDLSNHNINSGDEFEFSGTSVGIKGNAGNTSPLYLPGGSIKAKLDYTGNDLSSIIELRDGLNHNLGSGSTLSIATKEENQAVLLISSNLNLDNARLTSSSTNGIATGIWAYNSKIDLGQNSTIVSSSNLSVPVVNDNAGVVLRDSTFKAKNLTVIGNNLSAGIISNNTTFDLKGISKINSGYMGIFSEGGTQFTSEDLNITIKRARSFSTHPVAAIYVKNGDANFDLTGITNLNISGNDSYAIYLLSGKLKANELIINAKDVVNAYAITMNNATLEANKANIYVEHGQPIQLSNNSKLELNNADITVKYGRGISISNSTFNSNSLNIQILGSERYKWAMFIVGNSQVDLKNLNLNTPASGILLSESKLQLSGNTNIAAREKDEAILVESKNTELNQQGTLNSTGSIIAKNNGKISLNTNAGESNITGKLLSSGDGTLDWTGTQTTWNVLGESKLNDLNLSDDSHINFSYDQNYNKVTVDRFSGNSFLTLKADLGEDTSDTFHVLNSSSGQHKVALINNGASQTNGKEKKDLIFTADGKAVFSSDQEYEQGGYLYKIQRKDEKPSSIVWEIAPVRKKTDPALGSISSVVGNYLLNLSEQENLQKRMQALRVNPNSYGSWIRTYAGKFDSFSSNELKGFDMDYSGIQIGIDRKVARDSNKTWLLGTGLSYTTARQDYKSGSGKQKAISFALYGTYLNEENNWYLDLYGKYSKYRNTLNIKDSLAQKVKGKGNAHAITLSAEVGKRMFFDTNNKFYIEPTSQLTIGQIKANTLKNSNGLHVKFDKQNSVIARVGANYGYVSDGANSFNIYAKTNFANEFAGNQKYYLNNSKEKLNIGSNWVELGIGTHINFKEKHDLFFEINSNLGNKYNKYDVNLGYRLLF